MKVIVHGGAGGAPDEPGPRQNTLDDAAAAGADANTPLDAVEDAVRVLESDARFNAGRGGAVQSDGVIRTDAGVMTSARDTGAATSMPGVEHAVTVARRVMEDTPHIQLAGVHAVDFAADVGVETDCDLWTENSEARWDDLDTHPEGSPLEHVEWVEAKFGGDALQSDARQSSGRSPRDHDTVGAVAFDDDASHASSSGTSSRLGDEFAVATSTGGRWLALAGRVGDVPQVGSGFYASPAGAASATGAGEDIAKTTLTRRAVRHLESGHAAQDAARLAIEEFAELTGSTAGVIVLDTDGNTGEAFNSESMQTAVDE